MPTQYSITIKNNAMNPSYLMLYQSNPGQWSPNALAIAWFSKYSNPNSTTTFTWTVDYGVSWADTGVLAPGVTYMASEIESIDGGNEWTLDYNGGYFFTNQTSGADAGRIYVLESNNIPVGSTASVGITMSGKTVYAAQAQPNQNLTCSPHPTYYLAYGNYKPGQVIDVSTVNNPLQLNYPVGVNSLFTTLNANNTWTKPSTMAQANAVALNLMSA